MTFVSKLALAAMLSLGGSLAATPALAQDKGKKGEEAVPELKVSDEFRKPAAAADVALKAKDFATLETHTAAAEALAKNDDEKYYAAWLRLQIELEKKNEEGQLRALSVLASNPKTPPERARIYGQVLNFTHGSRLAAGKKHAEAIPYLLKARELGSTNPDLPVLLANSYSATGKNAEAVAEVDRAIQASKAAGRKPPEDWYKFIIPRVNQAGDRAAMATWLGRYMQEYPTAKNWNWAVSVFAQGTTPGANPKVEKLDLYRLKRATNALAGRGDYADYAFAAQQAGLPWEAVAVIDEGRKAGKVPAGDSDIQQTYSAAQAGVKSDESLDSLVKKAASAASGKAVAQTADALLASGDYARAVQLYDSALQKGGASADEVNLHRGIALRHLGRKDEAKAAFGQVKTGPYANLALLWAMSVDLPPLA